MIRLYLVRHAIAEDDAGSDEWRTLTEKGRRRFEKTARAFGRHDRLELVLTSPLVRAVQTAEILAGKVRHHELQVLAELSPGHDVRSLLSAVAKAAGKAQSIALVGHDPQLTEVLAELTHVAAAKLDFRKGAIVRLDVSTLPAAKTVEAKWWLKPRSRSKRKGLPLKREPPTKKRPPARAARTRAAERKRPSRRTARPRAEAASPSATATPGSAEPVSAPEMA